MENKEIIIKDALLPITLPKQKEITRQMEKCVCKIHINGKNGTGFFAKIPYKNSFIKVLMTNNHVLDSNDISENKIITFSLNNNIKNIKIDKERKTYTSEPFDTTIIEIKEELDDLKNVIEYLELDDINFKYIKENNKDFSNNHLNNLYKDESLYILNYLGGKEIVISYGFLRKIEESKIYHKCSTDKGSSGSPILSLENNRLIGIHYGGSNNFNFNLGTLIAFPIMEFQIINTNNYSIKKTLNSMTIIYKIDNDNRAYNKLRLFGEEFVKNNKDNCSIIIDGKNQGLSEHININEKMRKKGYLEIKLKENKTIYNMSHMFCRGIEEDDRILLWQIPDISKWNTINVTDMSYLFCCCENLESLPDISSWNTSNVKDMSNMISYCRNLESLPDISKWDTSNVTDMSHMFANDLKLKLFPDISKWNTSKVKDMEHMFTRCQSLEKIPDISKWDVRNVMNMSYMFSYCRNSDIFPDISKWNVSKYINLRGMFYCCNLSDGIPDISKWTINDKSQLFYIFYYSYYIFTYFADTAEKISTKFNIGEKYLDVWNIKGVYNK